MHSSCVTLINFQLNVAVSCHVGCRHLLCSGCIDVLCNNAGVMAMKDIATSDGYDVQMQVNHLSHFLLTKELLPLIKLAAESKGEARIVNHTSVARYHE